MNSFGELVMRHRGARICVMAGGPSLAEDVARVKADIWISVNEHGAKLRPVDYVVAMDNTHTKLKVFMQKHLRRFTDAPVIGPWHWNDHQLLTWPLQPRFFLSGAIANWAASLMGAHPLILAGFDCYGGDAATVRQHETMKPHSLGEVRVCSGPLLKFWKQYDPDEMFAPYVAPSALDIDALTDGEVLVKVRKPVQVRGVEWPIGAVIRASRFEVRRQIQHKSLEEVSA